MLIRRVEEKERAERKQQERTIEQSSMTVEYLNRELPPWPLEAEEFWAAHTDQAMMGWESSDPSTPTSAQTNFF